MKFKIILHDDLAGGFPKIKLKHVSLVQCVLASLQYKLLGGSA